MNTVTLAQEQTFLARLAFSELSKSFQTLVSAKRSASSEAESQTYSMFSPVAFEVVGRNRDHTESHLPIQLQAIVENYR